jgi:dipeptidyl aminopeptidase/acylaminoacyl peptidase
MLTPPDKFSQVKFIRWAPDGNRIAFATTVQIDYRTSDVGLWIVRTDGSGLTQLAGGPSRQFGGGIGRLEWSPDGNTIAFDAGDETAHAVFVVNANGQAAIRLTDNSTYANQPKWSPDGSKLAFAVHTSAEPGTVWIMDSSGANKTKLARSPTGPVTHVAGWLDKDTVAYLAAGTDAKTIEVVGVSNSPTVLAAHSNVQAWGVALAANRRVIAGVFQPQGSQIAEIRLLR